jgi:hypothetical protein
MLGVLLVNQNSDSQAEFGVANIHGALQQIQSQMASMNASIHNFRVVSHNSRIRAPQAYSPLQKSVAFFILFYFGKSNTKNYRFMGMVMPSHRPFSLLALST